MMPKVKVNAQKVIENIQKTLDLSKDFTPLMRKILGKESDKRAWTLRGGVIMTMATKGSFIGENWQELNPVYQARKSVLYPGAPMLVASGKLFRSLTTKQEGAVAIVNNRKMTFGTTIPYAKYLATGTKKMPKRKFLGINDFQRKAWKKLTAAYIAQTMRGNNPEEAKP